MIITKRKPVSVGEMIYGLRYSPRNEWKKLSVLDQFMKQLHRNLSATYIIQSIY